MEDSGNDSGNGNHSARDYDFPVFNPLDRMPGYIGYLAGNSLIDKANEDINKEINKRNKILDKAIKKILKIELLMTLELIISLKEAQK